MPDSRPGITLDEKGQCNVCRWYSQKKFIDWESRRRELHELADWARKRSFGGWDCVVGVSGGKDSVWQAHYVRDELGLNPLLVHYSSSEGSDLGRRNLETQVKSGFSLVSIHPKPLISRILSRKSFCEYGSFAKYAETALFPAPFRVAMAYGIPLVFFGENPGMEAGDSNVIGAGWDASTIRFNNTLKGADVDIWKSSEVSLRDLLPYTFPTQEELSRWGGKGVFMGYYLDWSGYRNAVFSIQRGLECSSDSFEDLGCHLKHNQLDWRLYALHAFLKFVKLGFGSTTEFVCYDLRAGRVTREEAVALVHAFDGKFPIDQAVDYCRWVGISEEDFWDTVNRFRGKMWEREGASHWKMIDPIWEQEPSARKLDLDKVLARLDTERLAAALPTLAIHPEPWEDEWKLK